MKNKIKLGYQYKIKENNTVLTGTVIEIQGETYKVKWSDGKTTIEDSIEPMMQK